MQVKPRDVCFKFLNALTLVCVCVYVCDCGVNEFPITTKTLCMAVCDRTVITVERVVEFINIINLFV